MQSHYTFGTVLFSESRNDVAKAEESHVDGHSLLVSVAGGACFLGPLRSGQVDQMELDFDGVWHALQNSLRASLAELEKMFRFEYSSNEVGEIIMSVYLIDSLLLVPSMKMVKMA